MKQKFFSFAIWAGIALLILLWLPFLAIIRLFDRDPVRYKTGRRFRALGRAISRLNGNWHIQIEGADGVDDRHPYVMVCNHLSNADIPLISNLPWEMKWVAKKELFEVPVVGWMMRMAGDISVDRSASNKRIAVFKACRFYLKRNCSVMFFPEGTRSRTGKMNRFAPGSFELAIREGVPILPLVIDGTRECLPKNTWVFEQNVQIKLKVLDPFPTNHLAAGDAIELMESVRAAMVDQIMEWRGEKREEVDAIAGKKEAKR
ncbi:MAG: lysophospholipid acyltransferase family protein [Balneolaceae bacterium]